MNSMFVRNGIYRNFSSILLSKDVISQTIKAGGFFYQDNTLDDLIINKSSDLNDPYSMGDFDNSVGKKAGFIISKDENGSGVTDADDALLLISVYYHYPCICYPSTMYHFVRRVLFSKILLV